MKIKSIIFGVLLISTISLWVIVLYINSHHYCYCSMDSWALSAPGLYSKTPFQLSTPLLGNFHSSNITWGLHFPGGPMLFSLLPLSTLRSAESISLIHIVFLLIISLQSGIIVWMLTSRKIMAFLATALILSDKSCAINLWLQRNEFLGAILAATAIIAVIKNKNKTLNSFMLFVCICLLPTITPIYVFVDIAIVAWLVIDTYFNEKNRLTLIYYISAFFLGIGLLAAFFFSNYETKEAFLDHSKNAFAISKNSTPFFGYNIIEFQSLYSPFFIGTLFQLLSLWIILYCSWESIFITKNSISNTWNYFSYYYLIFCCLLAGEFAMQNNFNGYYIVGTIPFATILGTVGLNKIFQKLKLSNKVETTIVVIICLLSSAYLCGRTYKWYHEGATNYRAEVEKFYSAIPTGGTVLAPEIFWELAREDHKRNIIMSSLPYNAGPSRQLEYLKYLKENFSSFDYFVVDRLQSHPSKFFDENKDHLIVIASAKKTWKTGVTERGFDLTLYKNTK